MLADHRTLRAEERPFSFFAMYLAIVVAGVALVCLSLWLRGMFGVERSADLLLRNHQSLPVPTEHLLGWGAFYPLVPLALLPLWPLARRVSRYGALLMPVVVSGLLVTWTWFGIAAVVVKSSMFVPR
jgi:hypothetical protein